MCNENVIFVYRDISKACVLSVWFTFKLFVQYVTN